MPGSNVRVETTLNGLTVSGQVATPADAERVMAIARAFLIDKQTVDNRLTVASSIQISLRVRIAEMSRSVSRELGVNWVALQGIGKYAAISLATHNPLTATAAAPAALAGAYVDGTTNLSGVIDALAQDDLVHLLARAKPYDNERGASQFPGGWRISDSDQPAERCDQRRVQAVRREPVPSCQQS